MTETITEVVNHASTQSDRWLFLATLALLLVGAVFAIRYFINQIQKIQMKADEQVAEARTKAEAAYDRFNAYLQEANGRLVDAILKHSEALERNTLAFDQNSESLERLLERSSERSR